MVRIEPASVGWRADLGFWRSEATGEVVGFYETHEEALEKGVLKARKILEGASRIEALTYNDYIDGKIAQPT